MQTHNQQLVMCLFSSFIRCEKFNADGEFLFKTDDYPTKEIVWGAAISKSPSGKGVWRTGGFHSKEGRDFFKDENGKMLFESPTISNRAWILNLRPFHWHEGSMCM